MLWNITILINKYLRILGCENNGQLLRVSQVFANSINSIYVFTLSSVVLPVMFNEFHLLL